MKRCEHVHATQQCGRYGQFHVTFFTDFSGAKYTCERHLAATVRAIATETGNRPLSVTWSGQRAVGAER